MVPLPKVVDSVKLLPPLRASNGGRRFGSGILSCMNLEIPRREHFPAAIGHAALALALFAFPALCAEKYRALTSEDGLGCEFEQSVSVSAGPGLSGTMSATATHFKCGNHDTVPVEIRTESVGLDESGRVAIRTKNFGTFYRGNKPGEFSTYEMTDSQIKKLKTFVEGGGTEEGSEDGSADSAFGRGEWMIVGLVAVVAVGILVFLRRTRPDSGGFSIK